MADAVRAAAVDYDLGTALPACLVTWVGLDSDDSGAPVELVDFPDRTVTIEGTFGVGGSCTLQGSNDGTNYYALTDPQGNAITKTAAGMELVTEVPRFMRPLVTAGDVTTAIQVRVLCRRTTR